MAKNIQDISAEKANRIYFIKIFFLITALVTMGASVFLCFYNRYNDKILYAERLKQMREVTTQLYSGLEDVVRSRWNSTKLQCNFLMENAPESVEELSEYMDKQTTLSELEISESDLIAVDSDGSYYTKTGRKGLLAEQRYLISKPEHISFVSNAMFDNNTKMIYLMQLSRPLTLRYGEKSVTLIYYGIMQDMVGLSQYFNCEAYDGNNGMYVVDEDGLKIFSDSAKNILPGYNVYSVLEQMEYLHNTSFAQAKKELDDTGLAYSNAVLDGEEYYYSLYQMDNAAWTLVFTVPSRYVATNTVDLVNTSTRIILIFSVVMLCICTALIFWILTRQQRIVLEQERKNNARLSAALEKAEHAEQMAKDANKAKSEFLANMSHDIRTPMNAIVGITQLMEHEEHDPEKIDTYIHKVQNSSQHLLGLINDILDMSKIESTEVTLNYEEINLAEQVGQVDSIIRPQVEERDQTFVIRVHEIVHEYLIGDAVRLRQIIINLLSNAVKYTPDGGMIRFDLAELESEDKEHAVIQITVTDNGYGMTQEFIGHIFESFTRAENSTTNKVQGTGLGMAITKNIVDMMGGTITVQSEVNKGSCFQVTLPLLIDKEVRHETGVKNVLLISRDEVLSQNVRASFRKSQVSLYEAGTKAETEQILHDQNVDAVLLAEDIQKTQLSDIIQFLRQKSKNTLVFCIKDSLSEQVSDTVEKSESDFDGVICRPFFLSGFAYAVNKARNEKNLIETEETCVLRGLRFMCAEDNELNSEILNALMDMNGATCIIYPDGQKLVEAFASVKPGEYDAILMDVQMPNMNGLEATRAIRNGDNPLGKNIPIIAMKANAFSSDVQECLDAGMDAHVSKPLDIATLERTLRALRNRMIAGGGR